MKEKTLLTISLILVVFLFGFVSASSTLNVVTNLNTSTNYSTISDAVSNAGVGDTIFIWNGNYELTSTLVISKSLSLVGESMDGVVLNATTIDGYGIKESSDNVFLNNFTLLGPEGGYDSSNPQWANYKDNYGLKVSGVSGITLKDLVVKGSGISEVDLNTVDNAVVDNVYAYGENTPGFGLMILNSHNIQVDGLTTSGNQWAGVSIQTSNSVGTDGVSLENISSTDAVPFLIEEDQNSGNYYAPTNYNIPSGDNYVTYGFREGDNYKQWYYFNSLSNAKSYAQDLTNSQNYPYSGVTTSDNSGNYYVSSGMKIQDAVTAAQNGDTINVGIGTFNPTGEISLSKSIKIIGAGQSQTIINISNFDGYGFGISADNVTLEGFTLQSDASVNKQYPIHAFSTPGVSGLTIKDVAVVGSYRTGIDLNGLVGTYQNLIENVTIIGADYGFGLALSGSQGVTIRNIVTTSNAWGDIGIYPSDQVTRETKGILFQGNLNLSDGTGAINLQPNGASPTDNITFSTLNSSDFLYNSGADVIVPSEFNSVVYALRRGDGLENYLLTPKSNSISLADSLVSSSLFGYLTIQNLNSGNYYVEPGMKIQDAINAAQTGDTINVMLGNYTESLIINKPVTLIGEGMPEITGNSSQSYIVKITSNNVTLNGFEINGFGNKTGDNSLNYGIWADSSNNLNIENSIVKNIWSSASNGIEIDNSLNTQIFNNTISSFQKRGIKYVDSNGTLYNNEIIGDNIDGTNRVQNLVNLWGGSSVEIYNNKLHNALTTPNTVPTWSSPAIFISSYGGNGNSYAYIHNNQIYDSDLGVDITSVYASSDNSSATIINNNFSNLGEAVNFELPTGSATINKNIFNINNQQNINYTGSSSLDATNNYWGTNNESLINESIYGNVSYAPWYTNENMTRLSFGAPVNDSNGTRVVKINKGLNLTNANSNITVSIPAGLNISSDDNSWDGTISSLIVNTTSAHKPSRGGYTSTISKVVNVGFTGAKLILSKTVNITLPGEAGKLASYSTDGKTFTSIGKCNGTIILHPELLPAEGDCYYSDGSDMIILTKHFTEFVTYTETKNAPAASGGSGGSSGGGGGFVVSGNSGTNNSVNTTNQTTNNTNSTSGNETSPEPTKQPLVKQGISKITGLAVGLNSQSKAKTIPIGLGGLIVLYLVLFRISEGGFPGRAHLKRARVAHKKAQKAHIAGNYKKANKLYDKSYSLRKKGIKRISRSK